MVPIMVVGARTLFGRLSVSVGFGLVAGQRLVLVTALFMCVLSAFRAWFQFCWFVGVLYYVSLYDVI
jgi:hypothetical protein